MFLEASITRLKVRHLSVYPRRVRKALISGCCGGLFGPLALTQALCDHAGRRRSTVKQLLSPHVDLDRAIQQLFLDVFLWCCSVHWLGHRLGLEGSELFTVRWWADLLFLLLLQSFPFQEAEGLGDCSEVVRLLQSHPSLLFLQLCILRQINMCWDRAGTELLLALCQLFQLSPELSVLYLNLRASLEATPPSLALTQCHLKGFGDSRLVLEGFCFSTIMLLVGLLSLRDHRKAPQRGWQLPSMSGNMKVPPHVLNVLFRREEQAFLHIITSRFTSAWRVSLSRASPEVHSREGFPQTIWSHWFAVWAEQPDNKITVNLIKFLNIELHH